MAMVAMMLVRVVSARIIVALSSAERCAPVTEIFTAPAGKFVSTERAAFNTAAMSAALLPVSDERNSGVALMSTWQPSALVMRPPTMRASPAPACKSRSRADTVSLMPAGSVCATSLNIMPCGCIMDFFSHASRASKLVVGQARFQCAQFVGVEQRRQLRLQLLVGRAHVGHVDFAAHIGELRNFAERGGHLSGGGGKLFGIGRGGGDINVNAGRPAGCA